ncbi:DDIT4 protein, partial [Aegithalos caudatus]|nr:DDIT4 protein [Aegithalos caudatus]
MPGLWERLAGGDRGRLETSDCESLGSASGSEGGECGSLRGWRVDEGPWAGGGGGAVPSPKTLPGSLQAQVRTELLRLACSEPCGLRGALLDLCVEHGKACHDVGHIAADPAVVPTFQLTLVLRLDSRLWPKIQGLFASGPAFAPLKLSTGFRVMKKKLYSSEQLLIEEC